MKTGVLFFCNHLIFLDTGFLRYGIAGAFSSLYEFVIFLLERNMGYKQIEPNMTFSEASLEDPMEHNRRLKRLDHNSKALLSTEVGNELR